MNLIEVPTEDTPVLINLDNVLAVQNNEGMCAFYFTTGVTETQLRFDTFVAWAENTLGFTTFEMK